MRGNAWGAAIVYFTALVITNTEAENARKKDREVSGLFPFPRVGRAANGFDSYSEFIKRQGLIPFPRVGRGGNMFRSGKSDGTMNEANAVWFGPRLGRGVRDDTQWALIHVDGTPTKQDLMQESDPLDSPLLDRGTDNNEAGSLGALPL